MATAPSPRRIGAEDSKTRVQLLDAAEQLLIEEGYAAVTSRKVAARADLKPQLVHYYFRTMDDLFLEVFRRRADENLERFEREVAAQPSLAALWRFGADPRGSVFTIELAALANHRKAIRAELARYAERYRTAQLRVLDEVLAAGQIGTVGIPPTALLLLLTGVTQVMGIERALGVTTGHQDTVAFIEQAMVQLDQPRDAPVPYGRTVTDGPAPDDQVPWRTIWAVIGSAGVAYLAYKLAIELSGVLILLAVAVFFAVVLAPAVDFFQRRAHLRRGLATAVVVLVGIGLLAGMLYSFIRPLAEQASSFADDLPTLVEDARHGEGPAGDLVERFDLEDYVEENQDRLRDSVSSLGAPAIDLARSVFNGLVAGLTVLVLTILMLLQGPNLTRSVLELVPERRRDQVRRVAADSALAVSGYVFGNLVISVIAGTATWIALALLGVPYAGVIGLFVAFTDLIPLIGATLGAIPTIAFAFLHSTSSGIVMTIFYVVYQQFENHVLQVSIMSRTVKVNPLTVLVSVLIGVELLGFLGALLAIPVAGVIQVIARDVYDERRGRWKDPITVGADETPVPLTPAKKAPAKKAPAAKAAAAKARPRKKA